MLRLTLFFLSLALGVTFFLSYELGLLGFSTVFASDKKEEASADTKAIDERESGLDKRERELLKRERAVADKQVVLYQQMSRYENVIDDLKKKLASLESLKDTRSETFRQVYERMDAKKASRILDEMDTAMAAQVLSGMKPDKAADILSRMATDKAKLLTEQALKSRAPASTKGPTPGQAPAK